MKLVFYINNFCFSGGRLAYLDYAKYLARSHDVMVLCRKDKGELSSSIEHHTFDGRFPECDLVVTTTPRETAAAVSSKVAPVVHFCQGFELMSLDERLSGQVVPPDLVGSGIRMFIRKFRKRRVWRSRKRRIDRTYRLPTHLVAVSPHLKEMLEARYQRQVRLCTCGIADTFCPSPHWTYVPPSADRPLRIISVGPHNVTFKGIPTTFDAIRILKDEGHPVHFTRVTPAEDEADKNPLVDELHVGVSQDELADLFRNSDVYISNSTQGEGFGLPAMEAMCAGCPTILSEIRSYTSFGAQPDYSVFVPCMDAEATAEAVRGFIAGHVNVMALRERALDVGREYSLESARARFESTLIEIHRSTR